MKAVLFLLSIIIVAGCISGGSGPATGTSVRVLKFEPLLSRLSEGDRTFVYLQVQNQGEFDAENVYADLYLHGGFEEETDKWVRDIGRLRAPNKKLGTAGQTEEVKWDLTAPEIGSGVKAKSYDFKVDVRYDYQASSWRQFPVIDYARVQKLTAEGKQLPGGEGGYVQGPIKIGVSVYEPVVFEEGEENYAEIKVVLEKVSGGYIQTESEFPAGSDCSSDLNCVDTVVLKFPEWMEADHNGDGAPDDCDFDEVQSEGMVEVGFTGWQKRFVNLIDGQSAQLDCKLKIINSEMGDAEETFPLIRAEAYYTHHLSSATNVEVIKVVGR